MDIEKPTADAGADIIDDEEYTEGDFTLISSDDVRFRVPSRVMFTARWVTLCSMAC